MEEGMEWSVGGETYLETGLLHTRAYMYDHSKQDNLYTCFAAHKLLTDTAYNRMKRWLKIFIPRTGLTEANPTIIQFRPENCPLDQVSFREAGVDTDILYTAEWSIELSRVGLCLHLSNI